MGLSRRCTRTPIHDLDQNLADPDLLGCISATDLQEAAAQSGPPTTFHGALQARGGSILPCACFTLRQQERCPRATVRTGERNPPQRSMP